MKKKDYIKLSLKYGVNPTIPHCFWCGKEKNEIALMGRLGDGRKGEDFEAPKDAVIDYKPCDECKAKWDQGCTLIEVSTEPATDGQFRINGDKNGQPPLYPSGRYCVITKEAFERLFPELNYSKIAFVEVGVLDQILKMWKGENE